MGLASKVKSSSSNDAPTAPTVPVGVRPEVSSTYPPNNTGLPPLMQFDKAPPVVSQPKQPAVSQPNNIQSVVRDRLNRIVHENGIHAFYPAHKLDAVMRRASSINYEDLARKWKLPTELAYDLSSLALYDIVLYCDDSGSMIFEDAGERVEDLKLIVSKVAEIATLFDDDGIVVRFMNNSQRGDGIKSVAEAEQLVQSVRYGGVTPIGTNLQNKVLGPLVLNEIKRGSLEKPVLVIIITDGEPSNEPKNMLSNVIYNALQDCKRSRYGEGAIGYQIAQVGKDSRAQAFLGTIDNHPHIGHVVDATSYFELECEEMMRKGVELTPEMWLVKMMLGGIDSSYDEADE